MEQNKKNVWLSLGLFVLYTGTYLFSLTWETPIKFYYYGMSAGTVLLFAVFLRRLKPLHYFLFTLFTVFAQYFGSMLGGYHAFWFYDLLLHLSSGLLLVLVGYLLFGRLMRGRSDALSPSLPVWFSAFFSIACAGLWEIYEFCGDALFHLQAQGGSLSDTMTDIIAGTIGALLGAMILYRALKKRRERTARP